jgi:hypothetical protein
MIFFPFVRLSIMQAYADVFGQDAKLEGEWFVHDAQFMHPNQVGV